MIWSIAGVVAKVLSLTAVLGVIGGVFCLQLTRGQASETRQWLLAYTGLAAVLGFGAACLFFLLEVGAINQAGLGGMFDPEMGMILAQTGLGYATLLRAGPFLTLALLVLFARFRAKTRFQGDGFAHLADGLMLLAVLVLPVSFSLAGHTAGLPDLAAFAISLHVLAAGMWIGSLYPLWRFGRMMPPDKLKEIMRRFGQIAQFFVGLLVLAGLYLLTQLLASPAELTGTGYGRLLLLKLAAVLGLLGLAALNKFKLVPRLHNALSVVLLQRSITLEMLLALLVLALTGVLTTLLGPAH